MPPFLIFLLIAPVVVCLGLMMSWVNPANNPFWVNSKLKSMKEGDEFRHIFSPEKTDPQGEKVRAKIVSAVPQLFKGTVTYKQYTDDKFELEATVSGRRFFGIFEEIK